MVAAKLPRGTYPGGNLMHTSPTGISRRRILKLGIGVAATGAVGAILAACGGGTATTAPTAPAAATTAATTAGGAAPTTAATATKAAAGAATTAPTMGTAPAATAAASAMALDNGRRHGGRDHCPNAENAEKRQRGQADLVARDGWREWRGGFQPREPVQRQPDRYIRAGHLSGQLRRHPVEVPQWFAVEKPAEPHPDVRHRRALHGG